MGNPHCVVFATPDGKPLEVNSMDLAAIGPLFERHVTFPKKTNTEFVQARERTASPPPTATGLGLIDLMAPTGLIESDRVCVRSAASCHSADELFFALWIARARC